MYYLIVNLPKGYNPNHPEGGLVNPSKSEDYGKLERLAEMYNRSGLSTEITKTNPKE